MFDDRHSHRRAEGLETRLAEGLETRLAEGCETAFGATSGPIESSLAGFGPAFEQLERAVTMLGACAVPVDAQVLVRLRGLIDRLSAVVSEAEVRFESCELWRLDGGSSLRNWLADRAGLGRKGASIAARRIERLEVWPEVAEAWRAGSLDGSQVDAIVLGVPARFVQRFADDAAAMVSIVAPLDADSVSRAVAQWVRCAESDDGPEQFTERGSGLFLDRLLDGRRSLSGEFTESAGAILDAAIRDFDVPDPVDDDGEVIGTPRTLPQRAADALVAACEFAIRHRDGASDQGRFLPHASVVVDVAELRRAALAGAGVVDVAGVHAFADEVACGPVERALYLEAMGRHGTAVTHDGIEIGPSAVSYLTCDCAMHRMMMSGNEVLEMGRTVRSATARQRRAVIARDRHCRAPGCTTRPKHCDVHHVVHWALGGPTDVDNLVLLCGTHHRRFHEPGYRTEFDPRTAEFTVHSPHGWSRSSSPQKLEVDLLRRPEGCT